MTDSRRLCPWAVLAMVLACGLCPLITLASIPVGLWALRDISRTGRMGRRLAWAAITVGLVMTPATSAAAWWWDKHVRVPLLEGPADIIAAGQGGDIDAFLAGMGQSGTADQAILFLDRLTAACGKIQSTRQVVQDVEEPPDDGIWAIRVPYEAMFEHSAASMTTRFLLSDPERGWVTSFDRLNFVLPDGSMLSWPTGPDGAEQ
ncbi:MAG: DUF4190 domain-containing protein [Phycisphaerales bacterium]|nr:DUF4190 domain-containing protein [Phycisphaerales bacterium]